MNNLYFACTDCRIYTDAGYRWAYSTLEDRGVVQRGRPVLVDAIFSAEEYWSPPVEETSNWLYKEVFPGVRSFLQAHGNHSVIFGDQDDFLFIGILLHVFARCCAPNRAPVASSRLFDDAVLQLLASFARPSLLPTPPL